MNQAKRAIDYRKAMKRSVLWGVLAGLGIGLVYLIIVSAVNSFEAAVSTFLSLWYWMVPIVVGFGLQVALFTYGRGLAKAGAAPHASGVMASGGTSAVSMIACCSHYLSNVLPLLGLTGLSLILSNYQGLFLMAGLLSNLVGIAYLLGVMGQHRLYDTEGKGLALLLRWPIHRFVPYVAAVAAAILLIAIYLEVFK
jgi:hypothetical protein